MNLNLLNTAVQEYITENLNADVQKIALAKSPFQGVSAQEISNQIISKKKCEKKLPTWFNTPSIYFPESISIEQTSSETTALYKSNLAIGEKLIDITAGFGVDSFYFAKKIKHITACEINNELATITQGNYQKLGVNNITVLTTDGIEFLKTTNENFDTIYIDPARRHKNNKVFMLKDCVPNLVGNIDFLLNKAQRIIIKTAPLLDITAGLTELKNVSQIHIVSTKNECKELIWVLDKTPQSDIQMVCVAINQTQKQFVCSLNTLHTTSEISNETPHSFLYEPDVALLKSGAFNQIGAYYGLKKIHPQSQLYYSEHFKPDFVGRVFKIENIHTLNDLKKQKSLSGNIIVRNFPEKPEVLAKKLKIKPDNHQFYIFTKTTAKGFMVIQATILQYY